VKTWKTSLFKELKISRTKEKLANGDIRIEMKKCFLDFGIVSLPNDQNIIK